MSGILRLKGASSGYVELSAPDSGANTTINTGLLVYKDSANGTIIGTDLHDSVAVQGQFDSAFPSAFDTRFALQDTHDSAAVQAQIDSAAVTLTGTQTITGAKTFEGTLEINGQGTSNYRHIYVNSNETIGGGITLKASGGIDWSIISTGSGATQGTGDLLFYRDATDGNSSSMIIKSNGNVGIGTTSPFSTARLQVKTDTNVNLGFQTGTTETSGFKLNAYNDVGNTNIPLEINGSAVLLKTGETERMRIDTSGNVGIGTTSPSNVLHVHNPPGGATLRVTNTTTGQTSSDGFHIGTDGSGGVYMVQNEAQPMIFYTSNTERMRIDASGRVTKPNQVGFQATRTYASTNQSLASDTAILAFDTTIYNIGSAYNTSTYRFTAPVAGRYLFAVTARFDALTSGSYARVGLMINGGTNYFRYAMSISGDNHSTNYESQTVTAILNLAANDYVQAYGGRNGGGGGLQFESQFSGILLG